MNNLKDIHNYALDAAQRAQSCYIRISMNNLKDIHNEMVSEAATAYVVILGFQ